MKNLNRKSLELTRKHVYRIPRSLSRRSLVKGKSLSRRSLVKGKSLSRKRLVKRKSLSRKRLVKRKSLVVSFLFT